MFKTPTKCGKIVYCGFLQHSTVWTTLSSLMFPLDKWHSSYATVKEEEMRVKAKVKELKLKRQETCCFSDLS